jgi:hypothetical protein
VKQNLFRSRSCFLPILIWLALAGEAQAATKRPNFLFIITDDQAAQGLRIYDPQTTLQTPVLDRLAAQGMTLDGAHIWARSFPRCVRRRGTWS